MKKKHDLISVVLRCYRILCIGQVTFKRGQEASFGYLLLGVYYRRIPGSTLWKYINEIWEQVLANPFFGIPKSKIIGSVLIEVGDCCRSGMSDI